jgi:Transcriptional regulators
VTRVTIQGIADRLGISKASVSYALNGQPGVSDATRERVIALAAELGWRPSSSARALSLSRADAIGMVLKRDPEMLGNEPYYMRTLEGVEDVLARADMSLLLRMAGTAPGRDIEVYRQWSAERRVAGVIVFDLAVDDGRPALLDGLGLPYVLHGLRFTAPDGGVTIDDQARDATLLVQHIASLGHRRLLHLTGPMFLAHELDRRDHVAQEARSAGVAVRFVEGDYTLDGAEATVGRMLAEPFDETAIVASNDLMALGVLGALRAAGRLDVALASWDDSMICRIATPTVTALARHPDEQGRRSARMLLEQLARGASDQGDRIHSDLIVRETSVRAIDDADMLGATGDSEFDGTVEA